MEARSRKGGGLQHTGVKDRVLGRVCLCQESTQWAAEKDTETEGKSRASNLELKSGADSAGKICELLP